MARTRSLVPVGPIPVGLVPVGMILGLMLALAPALAPGLGADPTTGGAPASAAVAVADDRPNIVLVMTDDMRDDDLRFMPYTRKFFQRNGVRFRNSFSNNPLCCPARATSLTGQHSHNHKVLWHEAPYGYAKFDDRRTLATALQDSGYRTGYVGKYLNGYGKMKARATGQNSTRYVPPGWNEWRPTLDKNNAGVPGGTYQYFDTTMQVNGRVVRNKGEYSTNLLGTHARQVVSRLHGDKPFFLYLSTVAPHHGGPREPDDPKRLGKFTPARPNWVKGRFDKMIRKSPGTPKFGKSPERNVSDKPWPIRSLRDLSPADHRAVRTLTRQRAESLYVVDREVKRLVAHVTALGELENTVFMFTSDNGNFLGEHRKLTGKLLPYEPSFRVPLLVSAPGGRTGNRYSPVSTVDLPATIVELSGARDAMPHRLDGRSFLPEVLGDDQGWTRPVIYEAMVRSMRGKGGGLSARGLRTSRWKFIQYRNGRAELYDLRKDPHELENLVWGNRRRGLVRKFSRINRKYSRCRGASCRAKLPKRFRVDAAKARKDQRRMARKAWK